MLHIHQVTAASNTKLRFFLYKLKGSPIHIVCVLASFGVQVHEQYLPVIKPLNNLVKFPLNGLAVGRRDDLSIHFGVICKLLCTGFQPDFLVIDVNDSVILQVT